MKAVGAVAFGVAVAGCAANHGTQTVIIDASAPNAVCGVSRNGVFLGRSTPERRTFSLDVPQYDLTIGCSAEGYQSRSVVLAAKPPAEPDKNLKNLSLQDPGVVDPANAAWAKYPERITVLMQPLSSPRRPVVPAQRAAP